jgi:hypothetical protein
VDFVAINSNNLQNLGFWQEKSVETSNVLPLGPTAQATLV